jgi:hypothetical protein
MRKRGTRPLIMAAAVVASGIAVLMAVALPAYAICDEPRIIYKFSKTRRSMILTNVRSPWTVAGSEITYSENQTALAKADMTASVSAEVDAVFAKASATLGVTVGVSWSLSKMWSIKSPRVPSGKEGRLVVYRPSRAFTVTKQSLRSPCKYVTVYSGKVNAPLKHGRDYVLRMQLRKPQLRTLESVQAEDKDDKNYEEIDVVDVKR